MITMDYTDKYGEITKTIIGRLSREYKTDNVVFSPMSIILLLAIAADAVNGKTRDEIIDFIGEGYGYEEIISGLRALQEVFCENGSLMSSNAVCVKNTVRDSIQDGYEERLQETFDGKLFSSTDIVRDVNTWVEEKTKGMIQNALDESAGDMLACLMNAIAFEASWAFPYENDDIREERFHNADKSVSAVQMMHSMEDSYVENEFFTGFIKPYKDYQYAFMALLPKTKNSVAFIQRAVLQTDFKKVFADESVCTVHVSMPEFNYDFSTDLTAMCKLFGVNMLFTPEADFSPMSKGWLRIDSIIHKAHIEVDRKGTKAAAATMAFVVAGCIPEKKEIKEVYLDRSFVYAIMHCDTGLPVFVGIVNHIDA